MKVLCHIRDTEQQLELDTDNMLIEIYWGQNTRNNGDMQNRKDWVQDNLSRLKLETCHIIHHDCFTRLISERCNKIRVNVGKT